MSGVACGVWARKGLFLGVRVPGLGPSRRGRRWGAGRGGASRSSGAEAPRRRTGRSLCAPWGGRERAAVPGAGARGVALGAGRATRGSHYGRPAGFGLRAPGAEGRDPQLPGRGETAPETGARVYPGAGLRPPGVGVRVAGWDWEGSRPVDCYSQGKLDCLGKLLLRNKPGIEL